MYTTKQQVLLQNLPEMAKDNSNYKTKGVYVYQPICSPFRV